MNKLGISLLLILACYISVAQVSNNEMIIKSNGQQGPGLGSEQLEILIFGNGGLRKSATGNVGSDNPANGSLGASFIIKGITDLTVGYTINNFNTISVNNSEEFGNNLLIPDLGGQSFTLSGTKYFNKKLGVFGELLIADSKWEIDSIKYEASPLSFKLGASIAPFGNISRGNNFISFMFFAAYSNRSLLGNIANEDDIRNQFFGTEQKSYHGIELGASLLLNQTKVFVNVPFLFSEQKIDGLTGGQVVIGVTISGDLLKL